MAFIRYANASVTRPFVSQKGWSKVRRASVAPPQNLVTQASEILGKPFNPDEYLLTHCTIVASVDVEDVPNVRLGRVKYGSRTINRKYSDYYITPDSSQFVNNNGDSWSRDVLLASYRTFIGAMNYLEHVQIEEQAKGRIIDAIARDIGNSVYIDILVATDRRHKQLIQDIESGKLSTLSMGCSVEETTCTKCGNVAVDETELCDHIKYEKLNKFFDDQGNQRIVAELCGHKSLGETGGVTFIEASWVASPAFTGAVMRNILTPVNLSSETKRQLRAVLESPPPEWDRTQQQKAAFDRNAGDWDLGDDSDSGSDAENAEPKKDDKAPLDELTDKVYDAVRQRVQDRIEEELRKRKDEKALTPENETTWQNDTVIKEAAQRALRKQAARHYQSAVGVLLRTASSDISFLEGLAQLNSAFGIELSRDLYRTALRVGSLRNQSIRDYLEACRTASGRPFTPAESRALVRIGTLLARLGSVSTRPSEE